MPDFPATRREIIRSYNLLVAGIDDRATAERGRAYGGVIRAAKGKLVESIAPHIIGLAWQEHGGDLERLSFGDVKTYRIPIQQDYVERLPEDVRQYVEARMHEYVYRAQVDVHVFVEGSFALGMECKAYTENAMLKRILVDFRLLKSIHPDLICCLLQLESQLGGEYSMPLASPQIGSTRSHTLMSYFPEVGLDVITLLEGERRVDQPIHHADHFKELVPAHLDHAIDQIGALLEVHI